VAGRRYFINLFTEETWRESRVNARFEYTGHTAKLRNRDEIGPSIYSTEAVESGEQYRIAAAELLLDEAGREWVIARAPKEAKGQIANMDFGAGAAKSQPPEEDRARANARTARTTAISWKSRRQSAPRRRVPHGRPSS
jgi:hypothetical protein